MNSSKNECKKWMQRNQVFDRDLVVLFPKYGVNDPDEDLKNLSSESWQEIQKRLKTDRASELKDSAAKGRMEKKLNKISKIWKAARAPPKKKKKKKDQLLTPTSTPTLSSSLS
eukprot:330208_1